MPLFSFSRFFGDVIFYRSDQFGRHPAHKAVIRHILCHHRACGYYHIVPYGHAGQDGHIPADPHIIADSHRFGHAQVFPPSHRGNGMVDGGDQGVRTNHNIVPDTHRRTVQYGNIIVGQKFFPIKMLFPSSQLK